MRLRIFTMAAMAATAMTANAAWAQDNGSSPKNWSGFYVGGQLGYSTDIKQSNKETVQFDRNLDGTFGDAFTNFSPGFCPGAAVTSSAVNGCASDSKNGQWKVNAGYDMQFGPDSGFVVGGVIDAGKQYYVNYVSAFSTTPANYVFEARLGYNGTARARAGYSFNTGTLVYGTGGVAYGEIKNRFLTSNTANTFTARGTKKGRWGYVYGGGIEQKVGNFSVGFLYTYTSLKNDDFVVRASGGPVGGPFTLQNASGTDLRRSRDNFTFHTGAATIAWHF
jgi:outer membrane immunogenic protein